MERVVVAGISGAGKSTLARAVAARCGLPYVEMDALFHGPGWRPRPAFVADVERFTATPRWVTDNASYPLVRELVWSRADTLVWLDYRRRVVMPRVIGRSVVRAVNRRPMWNGNREDPRTWFRADHPMRWAWEQHARKREQVLEMVADPRFSQLRLVHCRTPRETAAWLAALPR